MPSVNRCLFYFFILLSWPVHSSLVGAISVSDASGNELRLQSPARRIIALAPHIVENLFAAGAGEFIVGVSAYSDYPRGAQELPIVGDAFGFNLEAILQLQPDLVIAWSSGVNSRLVSRLRDLGIPVYLDEPRSLQDIARSIRHFGDLAGTTGQSQEAVASFEQRVQVLKQRFSQKKTLSVFFQVWHQPLQTLGAGHLINDVIRLCGGVNSFSDSPVLAPRVGLETVLQKNPAVIVSAGDASDLERLQRQWSAWPEMRAVKNRHLFVIPADTSLRHTRRILDGAEVLCAHLDTVRARL